MTNTPTTFFGWIIFLIQQYHGYYLQGLLTTLETSLAGTICGCFLGFLVGIIQATDIRAQDNMINHPVKYRSLYVRDSPRRYQFH